MKAVMESLMLLRKFATFSKGFVIVAVSRPDVIGDTVGVSDGVMVGSPEMVGDGDALGETLGETDGVILGLFFFLPTSDRAAAETTSPPGWVLATDETYSP